jgi:hypothetical protein
MDAAALFVRLQEHNHDADVQAQCCVSLCDSGQLLEAFALAFLPAVVAALRAHPRHERLQGSGCAALTLICAGSSEHALTTAGVEDGIRAAVEALRAHPAEAELQAICCRALDLMARYAGHREAAVSAGAVPVVVAALQAHAHDAELALAICDALGRTTVGHQVATTQATSAGALPATVALLRAHPASAVMQKTGCSMLASLAFAGSNAVKAIQAGVVEATLAALCAHPHDSDVQTYGCVALDALADRHAAAIRLRSSSLISDVTKAAVAALNAQRTVARVQRHACCVLRQTLRLGDNGTMTDAVGTIAAVVAALRTHHGSARVFEPACDVLACLCSDDSANVVTACGAGALQAIVTGMRAHPADIGVQLAGCHVLHYMVKAHPRLQAAAGAAGAVEAVAAAPPALLVDAALPRLSYGALFVIVDGHPGNLQRARVADVIETLAAAMGARCAHEDTDTELSMYDHAVYLLDVLLHGDDDAMQRAVRAGILDILVREGTQRSHPPVHATHARLVALLQAAAQRHDTAACEHDGCKCCATARDAGRLCALPGCGARRRDGGKRLNRCGACRRAAYCGPAHQREDWARHKDECAALRADNEDDDE